MPGVTCVLDFLTLSHHDGTTAAAICSPSTKFALRINALLAVTTEELVAEPEKLAAESEVGAALLRYLRGCHQALHDACARMNSTRKRFSFIYHENTHDDRYTRRRIHTTTDTHDDGYTPE
jgi:hypothetical protein